MRLRHPERVGGRRFVSATRRRVRQERVDAAVEVARRPPRDRVQPGTVWVGGVPYPSSWVKPGRSIIQRV